MRLPRTTIRRWMIAVAIVAVACKVLSELAGMEPFSWWFVSLLMTMFGLYLVTAFACGLVLDWVAPLLRDLHVLPRTTPAGPPDRVADLYEPCHSLIARSRRGRADRDADWGSAMADLSRADRLCRSLLEEATARLAALEKARLGQAVSAMEEIARVPGQPPDM
jgi:hypothetical protein